MDKVQIQLAKVIENYFGADAGYLDISCLDLAKRILDAGYEKPVRCKDCRDYEPGSLGICKFSGRQVNENYFCAFGERREGE